MGVWTNTRGGRCSNEQQVVSHFIIFTLLIKIHFKTFSFPTGLSRLEQLDLGFNQLSELSSSTFSLLPHVDEIDLGHNLLRRIPIRGFDNNFRLSRLILRGNDLSLFDFSDVENVTSLHHLDLSGNGMIDVIAAGVNVLDYSHSFIHSFIHLFIH